MKASIYGLLALVVVALVIAVRRVSVKLRAAAARGRGVRVYDLGCDVEFPARLSARPAARSYQIALYLTMKSRAPEPVERPVSDSVSLR
jgi:hypothetical protein